MNHTKQPKFSEWPVNLLKDIAGDYADVDCRAGLYDALPELESDDFLLIIDHYNRGVPLAECAAARGLTYDQTRNKIERILKQLRTSEFSDRFLPVSRSELREAEARNEALAEQRRLFEMQYSFFVYGNDNICFDALPEKEKRLYTPVDQLGLMPKTVSALKRAHLFTLRDIDNKTEEELSCISNIGPVAVTDILQAVWQARSKS